MEPRNAEPRVGDGNQAGLKFQVYYNSGKNSKSFPQENGDRRP